MNNNRDTLHSKSLRGLTKPCAKLRQLYKSAYRNHKHFREGRISTITCRMYGSSGWSFIHSKWFKGTQTKANVVLKQGKNNNSQMGFSTHNCPLRKSELGGNIGSQKPLRLFSAPALKLSLLICASLCITCDKSDYSGAWTRGEQCEWVIAPYTPYCAPSNAQRGASLDSHTAYLGPKASDGGPSGVSSSVGGRHSTKQRGSKWGRLVARAIFS